MREHIRLTTQPLDGPPEAHYLRQIIEQIDSDEMLLFASDYPHWHYDAPTEVLPVQVEEGLLQKILAENARTWYRL